MIAGRILYPGSDLPFTRFFWTVYYQWSPPKIYKDGSYRSLDALIGFKDHIKMEIFNALKLDISPIHYDLTSSYFKWREGYDLVMIWVFSLQDEGKGADHNRFSRG